MNDMTYVQNQKSKRRFSDEQIKSLEVIFRSDSRPELKEKHKLAGELGLQPRQVAVWFQNRRARSRTKHVEREYNMLKASHDKLVSSVESLKRENQELHNQLHELKSLLGRKRRGNDNLISGQAGNGEETGGPRIGQLEDGVLDLAQSRDGSLTSSVDWCSFDSSSYVDESSCPQWWEFWS